MKKIIAAGIIVVLIVVAAPFINGILMKKVAHQATENLNATYLEKGLGDSVEIISYKRGFFTSDIEWKIKTKSLQAVYGIDEVLLTDHAKHGYTGVVSTTNLDKNQWFKTFIKNELQGKNPFKIETTYKLTGAIQSVFTVDDFSTVIDGEQFSINKGKFTVDTDAQLKTCKTAIDWSGFSVKDDLAMGKIAMASDLKLVSNYIWDGDVSFSIEDLKAVDKSGQFSCKKLQGRYDLNVDQANNAVSGIFDFTTDKMSLPFKNVDNAKVKFTLNNLNLKGYEEFMTLYTKMMTDVASDPNAAQKAPLQSMMTAYEKLLKQGLEFKIQDLQVKLPEGDITADLTLKLLQDMSIMHFMASAGQPDILLEMLHLQSDISIPVALVGEAPKLLAPAHPGMQTGLFVKNGDALVHKAVTKEGKLWLNEKEVVLKQ